jgi:hypothetical protein
MRLLQTRVPHVLLCLTCVLCVLRRQVEEAEHLEAAAKKKCTPYTVVQVLLLHVLHLSNMCA